jgi:AbrB family looped-hinge helix DNA binding protein
MALAAPNPSPDIQAFSVSLQPQGQITVPLALQSQLNLSEGDQLTLLQVGDVILLTPKALQVPQLTEQIASLREAEGLSLSTLLEGLQTERQAMWAERQADA